MISRHALLAFGIVASSWIHAADWRPFGPGNGGNHVATHPTAGGHAMIASHAEGLVTFFTDDSGAHWSGHPWSITSFERPYLSGTIAWVAGDMRLWRSPDRGRSWTPVSVPSATYGTLLAGVNPTDPNELVLVQGDAVYHTTTGGASWSAPDVAQAVLTRATVDWSTRRLYAVSFSGHLLRRPVDVPGAWQATAVAPSFVAAGHGIVVYGTWEPFPEKGALFRSTDHGASFAKVAEVSTDHGGFLGVAFTSSPARLYAVDDTRLRRSDNGGATWTDGASIPGLESGASNIAADAADADRVYVASSLGIVTTSDGGSTVARLDHASGAPGRPRSIGVDAVAASRQWLVNAHHAPWGEGLIERTIDGGATWSVAQIELMPLASSRVRPDTLFGLGPSGSDFSVSTDGGASWTSTFQPATNFQFGALAQGGSPPALVLGGQAFDTGISNRVFVSVDDGQTFTERASPPIAIHALALAPSSSMTIYAGGQAGAAGESVAWRSIDGGATWTPLGVFAPKVRGSTINDVTAIAVDPRDPARVYAGFRYPDSLLRSDDAGATWSRVTTGLGAGWVTSIAIDPAEPDTLFAAVYRSGVFRSTDRGMSWHALDAGLRDDTVRQVLLDPHRPGRLYAATNSGVYSVDLGSGLPSGQRRAVEYYHHRFDHYFVSADLDEIDGLDDGVFFGWQRTNLGVRVAAATATGNLPTCRFFGIGFGSLSSHFYTPYAAECESVKSDPNWFYEKVAFGLALPDPATDGCAAGTRPLFRAWNRNAGGAPNHRYTTDSLVFEAMLAIDWALEGEGATRVFACVPLE